MARKQLRQSRGRNALIAHPRALSVCLLGLITPFAEAHGETTVDTRMERDTVGARSRPEVETVGARVGALLISPSFGIEADATDNVYARGDAKRGDFAAAFQPAITVQSQWSRHALGISAEGAIKRYARRTTENIESYAATLDGRLDIAADTRLSGDLGTARRIEARGTTGDSLFGAAPIAYTVLSGGGELEQSFARARITLAGRYERYRYENRALGGTVIDLSPRDYEALSGSLRAAVGIGPGVAAFASLGWNRNRYLSPPIGPSRNSHGVTVLTGLAFGLNRLLQGEIGVGWVRQDFTAPIFPRISGLAYNAQLRWSPTRLTTVRLSGGRTFQRSPIAGIAGIQQHEVALSAEHELLRTLILRPALRYVVADFQVPDGAARRQERYFTGTFGVSWRLSRHFEIAGDYTHSLGRNTGAVDPGRAYDKNRVAAALRWRL
ncbi:outer membrane beta-barrel protein [Novosphingobium sp.]|uniref:outer membrane beta-barrel protein n=1 Tax=Novosphingobium sp. TaxID=1874826 RepID=UPI003BAC875A